MGNTEELTRALRESAVLTQQWMALFDAAQTQRDALCAVLAPLLDDPLEYDSGNSCNACRFCGANDHAVYTPRYHRPALTHEPDCPVLRKDELLGRAPVAEPVSFRIGTQNYTPFRIEPKDPEKQRWPGELFRRLFRVRD